MYKTDWVALINRGENRFIEFKRQLNLATGKEKSEFVKDISALVNSADEYGYFFIGVEDNGDLVGTEAIIDEQIQKICHTYINPAFTLETYNIIISDKNIGVIVVSGTRKPYKACRDGEHLLKDMVFLRRGKVVFPASPEELIDMSRSSSEEDNLFESALLHKQVGNYDKTIEKLEHLIDRRPLARYYLELCKIKRELLVSQLGKSFSYTDDISKEMIEIVENCSKTLLAFPSTSEEKEIRLIRLELAVLAGYKIEKSLLDEDFQYLINSNIDGNDRIKINFFFARSPANWMRDINREKDFFLAIEKSDSPLSDAYYFIAEIYSKQFNYGSAIDAFTKLKARPFYITEEEYISFKIALLIFSRQYDQALQVIQSEKRRGNHYLDESFFSIHWEGLVFGSSALITLFSERHKKIAFSIIKDHMPNDELMVDYDSDPLTSDLIFEIHKEP